MPAPRPSVLRTSPASAAEVILRMAGERAADRPVLIGVTGPVGAGKTTLARRLSATVISTDDYLPDYETVAEHLRDEPHMADLAGLARDLCSLSRGEVTHIPTWSFHTHSRVGSRPVTPGPIIVCEGLHALHEPVAGVLDVRVFVEAPADVRWARWEAIERSGERGWGVEVARAYFDSVAEPTFARYAAELLGRADVVVGV